MRTRFLAAGLLLLGLIHSPAMAQGRSGGGGNSGGCTNPTTSISFASDAFTRISGDGQAYSGILFACGSNDATIIAGKNRSFYFDLSGRIPGSYASEQENWLTSVQPFGGPQLNVHGLGRIRAPGVPTTTWMTGQITGPDRKTYRLRMTPFEETGTGTAEIFGEGVNEPYETASVTATFTAGCAPCSENPYGKWEVVGDLVRTNEDTGASYVQVATIYRVAHTWIKMGQFELPFRMTVTLTSPLPVQ